MNGITQLPERIFKLVQTGMVSEYATVSAAGVPIDTPTYYFPSADMATIDLATGLSYPAKAERARRNPKVGLLIEGADDEPVVSIGGHAAVRDANLQGNAIRYLSETGFSFVAMGLPWSEARKAVWYWTRIIVSVSPVFILWWENRAAMEGPPQRWDAPKGTVYPASDPTPAGEVSSSPQWQKRSWQEIAGDSMKRHAKAHLTLCDAQGYPLPIRASSVKLVEDGFDLVMPKGSPLPASGKATVTFAGLETFVGDTTLKDGITHFKLERALPQHPLMQNPREVLLPTPEIKEKLMTRLRHETGRRNQSIPNIPEAEVPPTELALLRQQRMAAGAPITGIQK